jgi:F-type H+-transporting ATPase subunit b
MAEYMKFGLVELNQTFVIQIINTIVLFVALRMLLFKPVSEFMQKRADGIANSLKDAETKNVEADGRKAEYEAKLAAADEEGRQMVREAALRAEARAAEIIKEAEQDAKNLKAKAELEIQREHEKALNALKDDIASMAVMAASKIIEKDLDEASHKTFVQQFIDRVGDTKWQN